MWFIKQHDSAQPAMFKIAFSNHRSFRDDAGKCVAMLRAAGSFRRESVLRGCAPYLARY